MQGILLVDKPAGWTSFDVVNYVRKIVANSEEKKPKQVKVGHTGTLDPFATGLLVILVSKEYTKRAAELSKQAKTYEVTMRLGATSTTGDPEGTVTPNTAVSQPEPDEPAIEAVFEQFRGEIEQVPPIFSAVKVGGRRAYALARAGQEVTLEPRKVLIRRLELRNLTYPDVTFVTEVSSGTYIRSLVEDMGRVLGCGAYTTALRRTHAGQFSVDVAHAVEALDQESLSLDLINI